MATVLEAAGHLDDRVLAEGLMGQQPFQWSEAIAAMRHALSVWHAGGNILLPSSHAATIHRLLTNCPDEPAPRALPQLAFVRDARLRRSVARDIDSLEPLLRDGEWKAATVIGGSVVEALLLDRLLRTRAAAAAIRARVATPDPGWPRTPPAVAGLKFWQMIVVAQDVGLIDDVVAGVCDGARDYRNLIHAGAERARQPCDRGTALTAQAAVEALVQVFSGARR